MPEKLINPHSQVKLHHCSWFLKIQIEKVCCPEGISYFVSQRLFQSSMKSGQTSILNIRFCHPTFLLSSCGLMIRQGHQKSDVKQISALIYMGSARLCCAGAQPVSSLHCRMCVYTCMIYIYIYDCSDMWKASRSGGQGQEREMKPPLWWLWKPMCIKTNKKCLLYWSQISAPVSRLMVEE